MPHGRPADLQHARHHPLHLSAAAAHTEAEAALSDLYTVAHTVIAKAERGHGQDFTVLANAIGVFRERIDALLPTPSPEATIAARALSDWRMTCNRLIKSPDTAHTARLVMAVRADNLENAVAAAITFDPIFAA